MNLTVARVESASQWSEARRLVNEYADSLDFDLAFQDFDREIRSLETEYDAPTGCFLLAASGGEWVGCGGVRRFSEHDCEMKRLYVAPRGRGLGIGRALAKELIRVACDLGYRRMLLDTTPSMSAAQQLYASLGFTRIAPYRHNPIEGATFWQFDLGTPNLSNLSNP